MVLCLREPPARFLWCCYSFFIFILFLYLHFILLLLLFFIHIFFSTSFLTLPWTIVGHFTPHFILSAQPITEWFATLSFFDHSVIFSSRVSWVGTFYPQAFFTLRSFTDILTCIYQDFPGSRQFILEVYRASYWSSKHRPGPSVCLIHSNPQTSYSEQFSFKFYYVLAWITCGESLIYLLLTLFELFSNFLEMFLEAVIRSST